MAVIWHIDACCISHAALSGGISIQHTVSPRIGSSNVWLRWRDSTVEAFLELEPCVNDRYFPQI